MGLDYQGLADAQIRDPYITTCRDDPGGLVLQPVRFGETQILCDISTGRPRPVVPEPFRRQVFNTVHGLSHPSIRMTTKLVTQKFVWHSIRKDCHVWSRA